MLGQSLASLLRGAGLGLRRCFRLVINPFKPKQQEGKKRVDVIIGRRGQVFLQLPSARTFVKK